MNSIKRWYLDWYMRQIFKIIRRFTHPAYLPAWMKDILIADMNRCEDCPHVRELHTPKTGCIGRIGYKNCNCTWSGETRSV